MSSSTAFQKTNRLIHSTSPYLLQHARNPVDWYPWGEEALRRAVAEDRPIFLSIGYSACHWCHVMERESFEDETVARILNDHFVPIKVDREERPDLDEIYMSATMLANQGQGGWPMSVFLTPAGRPFFAGTYFPPRSAFGRPGFKDLLMRIIEAWDSNRSQINEYAGNLATAVAQFSRPNPGDEVIPREMIARAADGLADSFDRSTGGMISGGSNKFPPSMAMGLMLRECHHGRGDGKPREELLALVELTLDHMARGGIYDQLGGGICRYSTDPQWLVPHFEKMLYDQALVSSIYTEAFLFTRNAAYGRVACEICDYVLRDLLSPEGGFYSARDADSEGVEGKYYVWTKREVLESLGEEAGALFCSCYDVTDAGNWEGKNILNVPRDLETVVKLQAVAPDELARKLEEGRHRLLEVRNRRVPPGLDDKVLAGWNGLMIAALARCGRATGERRYVEAAERAANFILHGASRDGRLLRTWRAGQAHTGGYLDDYAFFIEGLLDLYEATFAPRWLLEAIRLTDEMVAHFWDDAEGAFFYTADDAERLIVRSKDSRDGAIPSGNSVALMDLLRVSAFQGRPDLRERAELCMRAFAGNVQQMLTGFERFLAGVDFYYGPRREVVIAGALADPATQALIGAVNRVYDPNRVVLLADPSGPQAEGWPECVPMLAGKEPVSGRPAAYVCRSGACRQPVTNADELIAELRVRR
jgi:uncharacterized protein